MPFVHVSAAPGNIFHWRDAKLIMKTAVSGFLLPHRVLEMDLVRLFPSAEVPRSSANKRHGDAAWNIISMVFTEHNTVLSPTPAARFSGTPDDRPGGAVNGLEGALRCLVCYADEHIGAGTAGLVEDAPGGHIDDGGDTSSRLQRGAVLVSIRHGHGGGDVVVAVVVQGHPTGRAGQSV